MNFEFSENGFLATLPFGLGVLALAAHAWFSRRFVQIGQFTALARRTELLEAKSHAASDDDVKEIERRISTVEASVGELRGDIRGVHEGIGRVEHMVSLLVQAGLQKEAKNAQ